jgi:hypothetical protein
MTYQETHDFREVAGLALTWEANDLPPLPQDRVEVTRRILAILVQRGYDISSVDNLLFADKKLNAIFLDEHHLAVEIRKALHIDIRSSDISTYRSVHEIRMQPMENTGFVNPKNIIESIQNQKLGDFIDYIEQIYQKRWRQSNFYGADKNAKENILTIFLEKLTLKDDTLTIETIKSMTLSDFPADTKGIWIVQSDEEVGYRFTELLEVHVNRYFALPSLLPCLITVAAIIITLRLGGTGVTVFLVTLGSLWLGLQTMRLFASSLPSISWKDPGMTLGELAERVVEHNTMAYARMCEA